MERSKRVGTKKKYSANIKPLESFQREDVGLGIADNLMRFTDATRLARAEKIEDEIKFVNNTPDIKEANMKDYYIKIDLKSHRIIHNCDDWKKNWF